MVSRRYRSNKSIGNKITDLDSRVGRNEKKPMGTTDTGETTELVEKADQIYREQEAITNATGNYVPEAGFIQASASPYFSSAWYECNGQAVSRVDDAALFAAIGTLYGAGNGTTTFNVPNYKGRTLVGYDTANTLVNTMGKTGGSETVTLGIGEIPAHTHVQNSHNHTQNSHNHTQDAHNHTQNAHTHTQNAHTHTQNAHSHAQNVSANSGGSAQRRDWSSDGDGGVYPQGISTDQTIATNQNTTAVNQNTTATNNSTTATNNATTATNIATTAVNQNAGGGGAHNNMQPFSTAIFLIKR